LWCCHPVNHISVCYFGWMAFGVLAAPCPVLWLPPLKFPDAIIHCRKFIVVIWFLWFSLLTSPSSFKKNSKISPSRVAALQGMLDCTFLHWRQQHVSHALSIMQFVCSLRAQPHTKCIQTTVIHFTILGSNFHNQWRVWCSHLAIMHQPTSPPCKPHIFSHCLKGNSNSRNFPVGPNIFESNLSNIRVDLMQSGRGELSQHLSSSPASTPAMNGLPQQQYQKGLPGKCVGG